MNGGGEGHAAGQLVTLRTGAWYGDGTFDLSFPAGWDVEVLSPSLPPELDDHDIVASLRSPIGQAPLSHLARGSSRPVVLVDDLTRPTPVSRVLPAVLSELEAAGVASGDVTIVMATGTHGPPSAGAWEKKLGARGASTCRLRVHDHRDNVVRLGRTSFGTPVLVDRDVAAADLVIGIGGVYPQHSTWFGGGSKLVLGVLGERSIANLHYRHWNLAGPYATDNDFRRDLDEVAALAGLRTSISLHVDGRRRLVRMVAGDQRAYYPAAARFSRDAFRAAPPKGADVVIANAYPMDVSLTFACSKGVVPLRHAPPGASRVLIASCSEGDGRHGLFPLVEVPRHHYRRQWARRQLVARAELPSKVRSRGAALARRVTVAAGRERAGAGLAGTGLDGESGAATAETSPAVASPGPVHLFRPRPDPPVHAPGSDTVVSNSWSEVVSRVAREQGGRPRLRAVVYACAPLQTLALAEGGVGDSCGSAAAVGTDHRGGGQLP